MKTIKNNNGIIYEVLNSFDDMLLLKEQGANGQFLVVTGWKADEGEWSNGHYFNDNFKGANNYFLNVMYNWVKNNRR
jgi:hypothetical protein